MNFKCVDPELCSNCQKQTLNLHYEECIALFAQAKRK